MNRPKIEFIAYIIHNLGKKTVLYLICNGIYGVFLKSVKHKGGAASVNAANKQLVCVWESGVARCQSQHLCHFL